jgi:DNA-binding transcriptional regulator YiaG
MKMCLQNAALRDTVLIVKKTAGPTATTKRMNARSTARSKSHAFLNTVRSAGASGGLDVKRFCDSYRVTQDTFTRLTGFSPRAVAHWAQGQKPSDSSARRLTELKRIFDTLEKLISPEAIGPWLKQPNPAFDGSTPLQVIERGETDRIWRMIYELESGEPG